MWTVRFQERGVPGSRGGFADAARRGVDDALQRHGVVRIADQAEIAEQVFDFGAFVEAESADHGVADVVAAQGFFNEARLRVGAVEDGGIAALVAGSTASRRNV